MTTPNTAAQSPWYRQFWPWFLLALPAAALVAGVITLHIALRYSDVEIKEPTVKYGLAVEPLRNSNSAAAARR